jgi:hypothetical protein
VPFQSYIDGRPHQQDCRSRSRAPHQIGFAYLHEILARRFGADFRQGGWLSITFLGRIHADDQIAARGEVSDEEPLDHRTRMALRVWLENRQGELIARGDAQVTVPSPLA